MSLRPATNLGIPVGDAIGVVAVAGQPNVGKTTIFNALTGLRHHTGNWPGKTVEVTHGRCEHGDGSLVVVDLPGAYSLFSQSAEEEVARDFLIFGKPDATVVVVDATRLARGLRFALQIMEMTSKVVVCVNLIDQARQQNISIARDRLEERLGVPVVLTAATSGEGLDQLRTVVVELVKNERQPHPIKLDYGPDIERELETMEARLQPKVGDDINTRWLALRILSGDHELYRQLLGGAES